ncbi:DUF2062 domain-containing protein [Aliikangiella marina]|uniref:DUF2062 domain-containing protein n=1 Tax=Aliikangiella marina TaxID=1712262 RepID=A0A545TJA4_9GAMM|nr:DUF2062 domain-containing protein [Aliikangiella marina]TQV77298.1 DUF2062 domain-containing protein [Aliikangiella marina]
MARKIIKRYLPDPDSIKDNRFLKVFGKLIHDPQLWHLTRFSVGHAFLVGLFCAFIPVPFQMLLAAGGAVIFRANIAISVALVWVTNPLTMPFIFGFAYLVGVWTLREESTEFQFELSWDWLSSNLSAIWEPFLLGCLICGTVAALLGYAGIRLFWRLHVLSAWQERVKRREKIAADEDK